MKTYLQHSLLLFAFLLCNSFALFSQVGINTKTPRTALEVAGDMQISSGIEITNFNSLTDGETSTFLIQDADDTIKTMDVSNPTGAALGYIQTYEITNPEEDWVKNFDTGIDATDFVLITISAYFDRELDLSDNTNETDNTTTPYSAGFIENGTWHLIADFPVAANRYASEIGTWTITTLIFSSDLSKQFGTITVPMSNSTTGTAVSPIID